MSELGAALRETAQRILGDHPPGTGTQWPAALWRSIADAGFDAAVAPESAGGSGVGFSDAGALLFAVGRHASPVPLAEAMIARWLLGEQGAEVEGLVSLAASTGSEGVKLSGSPGEWRLDGTLARVPWARNARYVAAVCDHASGPRVVLVEREAAGVSLAEGINLAGEPRDTLALANVAPKFVGPSPVDAASLLAIAAVTRSAQMAGAIERTLALSVDYANLREQFGRPIGKFQAIQQSVAVLATQSAAAKAAAEAGLDAIDDFVSRGGEPPARCIAAMSAKIRAGEAAGIACAISHQVFGAIGFTQEHELHHSTQRLWSWRDECGNEAWWSRRLGEHVLASRESAWRTLAPLAPLAPLESRNAEAAR
ncbi:acyl-CoA dehydrogenase family protein [Ramlibacter sp.]|uniref:acyl-CoA dehydrogenase family protein n=1 Tax=Ramlibacter sp. TaxID=1917967 RepID=UPI003D0E0232